MCSRLLKRTSLILLTLFLSLKSTAQVAVNSLDLDGDVDSWFDQAIGYNNTGILIGRYQEIGRNSRSSHPFYGQDVWADIRMEYRGETYQDLVALYDLQKDLMVIRHPTDLSFHSQPILLNQGQIAWFEMNGNLFRLFDEEILLLPPGFMEVLHEGTYGLSLYAKRIRQSKAEQTLVYTVEDRYIIDKNGTYFRFRNLRSFIRLFGDQKKQIRKFVRQNQLRVKKQNDQDLRMLAAFCDELLSEK